MWNISDNSLGLTFNDVQILEKISSVKSRNSDELSLSWSLGKYKFTIPVISSNMTTITEWKMAIQMAELGGLGIIHRFMTPQEQHICTLEIRKTSQDYPVCHSVGSMQNDSKRIDYLIKNNAVDIICIDIAHGNNTYHMMTTIRYIKELGFKGPIISGNVASPHSAKQLVDWGANMVKVGIGAGSVCKTRIKTGIGVPQLTAIGTNSEQLIIADGGIKEPADACKALAAGATAVMIGGMLAGTDCVPGWDLKRPLLHAGNASSHVTSSTIHNEGVAEVVPRQPKDSTKAIVLDICEGIRSSMSYVGARTLQEYYSNTEFIRVTNNGAREGYPHILN